MTIFLVILISISHLQPDISFVNSASHHVQAYQSNLSNDDLETLLGIGDRLKGDDSQIVNLSNKAGGTGPRYSEDISTVMIQIINLVNISLRSRFY